MSPTVEGPAVPSMSPIKLESCLSIAVSSHFFHHVFAFFRLIFASYLFCLQDFAPPLPLYNFHLCVVNFRVFPSYTPNVSKTARATAQAILWWPLGSFSSPRNKGKPCSSQGIGSSSRCVGHCGVCVCVCVCVVCVCACACACVRISVLSPSFKPHTHTNTRTPRTAVSGGDGPAGSSSSGQQQTAVTEAEAAVSRKQQRQLQRQQEQQQKMLQPLGVCAFVSVSVCVCAYDTTMSCVRVCVRVTPQLLTPPTHIHTHTQGQTRHMRRGTTTYGSTKVRKKRR